MKLQQLRYAVEVWRHNLNVSDAAAALFTSQPGISKQIRLLEEELGVPLFIRSGKRIVAVTPAGQSVLETAAQVLRDVQNIKSIGNTFGNMLSGSLTLAATPSHLRFRLPESIRRFKAHHPDIHLQLKCAGSEQIARMVANGEADLALGHDFSEEDTTQLRRLPCGRWHYALLLPEQHEWAQGRLFDLADLCAQPLIRYDCPESAGALPRAFARLKPLRPQYILDAPDADTAAEYVRAGLGMALMDTQAALKAGNGLHVLDISRLFEPVHSYFLVRADMLMRPYDYDFIQGHCAELDKNRVEQLLYAPAVEDFSI